MPLQDVVVTARITPAVEPQRDFGRTLLLTDETGSVTSKAAAIALRTAPAYRSVTAMNEGGHNAAAERAAAVYFQQSPYPKDLIVGTRIGTAQPTLVFGIAPADIATLASLGNEATITLNGVVVSPIDLSSVGNLAAVATAVAAGINSETAFNGVEVRAENGALSIELPSTIAVATGVTDSDTARALGLAGAGVVFHERQEAAETLTEALDRIDGDDSDFYWVAVTPDISAVAADVEAVADWVNAQTKQLIFDVSGAGVLEAAETASIGAVMSAKRQNKVSAIYGGDEKAIGLAAIFSSVNFNLPGGQITGKFKRIQGTTADKLTAAQIAELDRKRINHYTDYTAEGVSFGTWIDTQYWIDWFADAMKRAVDQLFQGSGVVPHTSSGAAAVRDTVIGICRQGVINGGIAPAEVSAALRSEIQRVTGNEEFDGFLTAGYLVHVVPVSEQSQADRSNRVGPGVKVFVKGAGAIHDLAIDIVLEQ